MSESTPEDTEVLGANEPLTDHIALYRTQLHRWLSARLQDPSAADDVAQEVFNRFARLPTTALIRSPLRYLFGIAFHVISECEFKSRQGASVLIYDSDELDRLADSPDCSTGDDVPRQAILQLQLEAAMSVLPENCRNVLLLCKRDGFTREEAAEAMGLCVHTVERCLGRGKVMLAEILQDSVEGLLRDE